MEHDFKIGDIVMLKSDNWVEENERTYMAVDRIDEQRNQIVCVHFVKDKHGNKKFEYEFINPILLVKVQDKDSI